MQNTYTRTLFYEDLTEARVILCLTEGLKHEDENRQEITVTGLKAWTIVEGGKEAEEIEKVFGIEDEYHEYLILNFANGEIRVYRNSHVVMFIL